MGARDTNQVLQTWTPQVLGEPQEAHHNVDSAIKGQTASTESRCVTIFQITSTQRRPRENTPATFTWSTPWHSVVVKTNRRPLHCFIRSCKMPALHCSVATNRHSALLGIGALAGNTSQLCGILDCSQTATTSVCLFTLVGVGGTPIRRLASVKRMTHLTCFRFSTCSRRTTRTSESR